MTDPSEVISVTIGGKTFRTCRHCAAHLEDTIDRLAKAHPTARLRIIQPSFNTGVSASAGTHDYCSAFDVEIANLGWWDSQRFLRTCGWAAWFRFPPAFPLHIHKVSIGCPARVGIYVPGQLDDYRRHALGLKGQHDSGADTSWFPADIASTIFDYPAWLQAKEDDMPLNDADKAFIRETIHDPAFIEKVAHNVQSAVWGREFTVTNGSGATAKKTAGELHRTTWETVKRLFKSTP